jgi:hypothetical protein
LIEKAEAVAMRVAKIASFMVDDIVSIVPGWNGNEEYTENVETRGNLTKRDLGVS